MDISQQKEQISIAYIRAISSVAGYSVYKPEVDDDSVDIGIAERGGGGTVKSPRLEVQLKCTSQDVWRNNSMSFRIKKKNYDDLRCADILVPRILVVFIVPDNLSDWLFHSQESLVMRRCGYWLSLRNYPDRTSKSHATLKIPRQCIFNVETLRNMMSMISMGVAP